MGSVYREPAPRPPDRVPPSPSLLRRMVERWAPTLVPALAPALLVVGGAVATCLHVEVGPMAIAVGLALLLASRSRPPAAVPAEPVVETHDPDVPPDVPRSTVWVPARLIRDVKAEHRKRAAAVQALRARARSLRGPGATSDFAREERRRRGTTQRTKRQGRGQR